jgi:hypothetical protein
MFECVPYALALPLQWHVHPQRFPNPTIQRNTHPPYSPLDR